MTYKTNISIAWSTYTGLIFLDLLVDYTFRKISDDFFTGGIPEFLWFFVQILAALIGGFFVFNGTKLIQTVNRRMLSYTINVLLGVLFYFIVIYSYVLGLGIDSF